MRKILQFILKFLAKLVLKKYKPVIIAVTGSVGKTSTKEAIYHVLRTHFGEHLVRRNQRNYNNEIGVPLTIFGLETGGRSIFKWFFRFIRVFWIIVFNISYPDFLIIEMGADRPGDIKYLLDFVHPKVGIITALGDIPVHVEFFNSPQQLAQEKRTLVSSLKENETAILNYDDEKVRAMAEKLRSKTLFYGLEGKANVRATNYDIDGNFKLEFNGSSVPAKLNNVLGTQNLYSALAAAAVGISFNMNLVEITEALKEFHPLPGRMKLIKGIKNTLIVDDTYNAALLSMEAALDSLKVFNKRKIAVLGDMLEIGEYAPEAHERIGEKAAETADLIFTVGIKAKFIADSAIKKDFPKDRIFQFDTSDQAKKVVQEKLEQGDVILIKGSQSIRMEKIVKEIMAEPEKAEQLLVRQDKFWLNK